MLPSLLEIPYSMLGDLDGNPSSLNFIANWANLSTLYVQCHRTSTELYSSSMIYTRIKLHAFFSLYADL
jgi:hypothetical protein